MLYFASFFIFLCNGKCKLFVHFTYLCISNLLQIFLQVLLKTPSYKTYKKFDVLKNDIKSIRNFCHYY